MNERRFPITVSGSVVVDVTPEGRRILDALEERLDESTRDAIAAAGATIALNREVERGTFAGGIEHELGKDSKMKTDNVVTPSGVVKVPGRMTGPQRAALLDDWNARYTGPTPGATGPPPWNRFERWGLAALLVFAALFVVAVFYAAGQ